MAAAPPPEDNHPDDGLQIPEPSTDPALNPSPSDTPSLEKAMSELLAFSSDKGWERHTARMDWKLRRYFRIALFWFVLGINIWWTWTITRMLWHSGMVGSTFRLTDSVLIALVSTSIANFLGLVVIVARHLFPSDSPK
jgi:hypothetical protein